MLEFKFDTQLLIEGHNLSEDAINEYITNNLKGDCLLAVGDEDLIKIHFHTNEPWQLLWMRFLSGRGLRHRRRKRRASGKRSAGLASGAVPLHPGLRAMRAGA